MSMLQELVHSGAAQVQNHLWQSTAFAAAIGFMTLLLRNNQARIRHALWVAASVKFLVPFSLLIALGDLLPKPQQLPPPTIIHAVTLASQPFSSPIVWAPDELSRVYEPRESSFDKVLAVLAILWAFGSFTVTGIWIRRWSSVSAIRHSGRLLFEGREVELMRKLVASRFAGSRPSLWGAIQIVSTREGMEPGIFGIFHPILLWPGGLSQRLNDQQLEAIFAHELSHARRHDNLMALLHMLVESVFWFHPVVWWIGRKLMVERERACDESVVALLGSVEDYANGILTACRFCVEASLPCTSGISGADLNQRIVALMSLRVRRLSFLGKVGISSLLAVTFAAPLALGLTRMLPLYGQILRVTGPLPSFEVATIKPWKRPAPPPPGEEVIHARVEKIAPNGFPAGFSDRITFIGQTELLIASAYNIPIGSERSRIIGAPDWVTSEESSYDIRAKIDSSTFAEMQSQTIKQRQEQVALMKQSLLTERFKLKVHFETRVMPTYALVVAKEGAKLSPAKSGEINKLATVTRGEVTEMTANAVTMDQLVHFPVVLSGAVRGRPILDQTGMKGAYDFTLKWLSQEAAPGQDTHADAPGFFAAIQEQLGFKLVPSKGPVEVIVIDHIQKPNEN